MKIIMSITQNCCKEIDYGCKSRRHRNHDLSKVKECLEHVCKLTSFTLEGTVFILNVGKLRFKIMIRSAHSQLISDTWETVPYNCLIPNLWYFLYNILDSILWELGKQDWFGVTWLLRKWFDAYFPGMQYFPLGSIFFKPRVIELSWSCGEDEMT